MKKEIRPAWVRSLAHGAALIAVASSAAAEDPWVYQGLGFVERLVVPPTTVRQVVFGDFNQDQFVDLAVLNDQAVGNLVVHKTYAEQDARKIVSIDLGFLQIASTRSSCDRLWALTSGGVVMLVRPSLTLDDDWVIEPIDEPGAGDPTATGVELLRAQDRLGATFLLTVRSSGTIVRVRRVTTTCSQTYDDVDVSFQMPSSGSPCRDLALVDWNDDDVDELALFREDGLWICSPTAALHVKAGSFQEPSLAVLPAAQARLGRDVLLARYNQAPDPYPALYVGHQGHDETIAPWTIGLGKVCFAEVTGAQGAELILPVETLRQAMVATQMNPGSAAYFGFNYDDVAFIDLASPAPTPTSTAPATAVWDLDGDGDDEVLFADNRGYGMVITSNQFEEDLRRVVADQIPIKSSIGKFSFNFNLLHPGFTPTKVVFEIWFKDPEETAPTLWYGPLELTTFQNLLVDEPLAGPDDGVYYILFRPYVGSQAYPVRVDLWTADPETYNELFNARPLVYPWDPSLPPGGLGVVRHPKIKPLGG